MNDIKVGDIYHNYNRPGLIYIIKVNKINVWFLDELLSPLHNPNEWTYKKYFRLGYYKKYTSMFREEE